MKWTYLGEERREEETFLYGFGTEEGRPRATATTSNKIRRRRKETENADRWRRNF